MNAFLDAYIRKRILIRKQKKWKEISIIYSSDQELSTSTKRNELSLFHIQVVFLIILCTRFCVLCTSICISLFRFDFMNFIIQFTIPFPYWFSCPKWRGKRRNKLLRHQGRKLKYSIDIWQPCYKFCRARFGLGNGASQLALNSLISQI